MLFLLPALLCSAALEVQDQKHHVPDAASVRETEKLVREVFKEDYARKAPADRAGLARKLLKQGIESNNDPPPQFVLFSEARDIAAQAGDLDTALAAIAELGKRFQVDAGSMKASVLAAAAKTGRTPEEFLKLTKAFLALSEEAATEAKYDAAEKYADQAAQLARKAKDLALVTTAGTRAKEYAELYGRHEKVARARETLAKNPGDPGAHLALGQYLCFAKGDWETGLPHLAKGSDPTLKDLASRDVTGALEPAAQVSLGDAWWDLGEKDASSRAALRQRAAFWYQLARERLTGLTRARIDKRIESAGPTPNAGDLDLLSRIDPALDSLKGAWKFSEGKLISPVFMEAKFASCAVPYSPPSEYDLTVVAERRIGRSSLAVGLVAGGKQFDLELDGFDGNAGKAFSGLDRVDGIWPPRGETAFRGGVFDDRAPHTIVIRVRKTNITVLLDGKQVLSWNADYRRVSAPHPEISVKTPDSLFLAAWQSEYAIHQFTLKPVSGTGRFHR